MYVCMYVWLCWVFISVRGLSLVVASGGHSSSRCAGLSLSRALLLRSTGSRRAGSVIVAHGPSCSVACGIFPDQGSNPCPLHWQADSQPLRHQGSPFLGFFVFIILIIIIKIPVIFTAHFDSQAYWYSLSHLSFPVNLEFGRGKCGIWGSRCVCDFPKVMELAIRTSVTSRRHRPVSGPKSGLPVLKLENVRDKRAFWCSLVQWWLVPSPQDPIPHPTPMAEVTNWSWQVH